MAKNNKNTPYSQTHIGTKRYTCKTARNKEGNIVYPIVKKRGGNYESMVSFKNLPKFNELKKNGRSWKYTKNYKPVIDRILLDIDCPDGLDTAFEVTKNIMQELAEYKDSINIYFSGSKGVHIEILTTELDIIDTTVERPMYACSMYTNFLNYFQDKYNEVDLNIKDVGTRIFRKHHTKHEKTGNYKILININAEMDDILKFSKKNKDMVNTKKTPLSKKEALRVLNSYSKPVDNAKTDTGVANVDIVDNNIFINVYNDLKSTNTNIHSRIILIGAGLNGYVTKEEVYGIYNKLSSNTDIEDSSNAKQSFIDAFENDKKPYNLGALNNHYTSNGLNMSNFNALSDYLEAKRNTSNYEKFQELYKNKYNNDWFEMLETELYDYVDNTENIFKVIINCLMALYGYGSRILVVNGGSTVGKSEFILTLEKLMVKFLDYGSGTPASVRRKGDEDEYYFDKKIVYLGDKGLKGKTQNAREELIGLYEVFGGLVSEKKFKRPVVINNKSVDIALKSDGVCVLFTEPYTDSKKDSVGDQHITRSTFIIANDVKDPYGICRKYVFNDGKENPFYELHRGYISYILKHPLELKLENDVYIDIVYSKCKGDIRTFKYLWGLLQAYCQYIRDAEPNAKLVDEFLDLVKPQEEITEVERLLYKMIYKNLKPITHDEVKDYLTDDGRVYYDKDILKQRKNRDQRIFFTYKQIQIYFKGEMKNNVNLKDIKDNEEQIESIIKNLYNADYLGTIEYKYRQKDDLYYIVKNEEMERWKENMQNM